MFCNVEKATILKTCRIFEGSVRVPFVIVELQHGTLPSQESDLCGEGLILELYNLISNVNFPFRLL